MKVIKKPWGKEEVIELNDHYMIKKLTIGKVIAVACNTTMSSVKRYMY